MIKSFLLMIGAFVILTKGADWFVDSSVIIAEMTGIPKAIIGATIVAIGTTFPEFVVSFTAAINNESQISLGNIIGSVLCNIGLCLAIAAIIRPIKINKELYIKQSGFMIIAGVTFAIFAYLPGAVMPVYAFIFLGEALLYMALSVKGVKDGNNNKVERVWNRGSFFKEVNIFLLSLFMVIIGARLLISSGVAIAHILGVPKIIIALTLIAIGTSLPELITGIASALKKQDEIAIGNVVGANILDITWALGASSLVKKMPIPPQILYLDLPLMLLLMSLVLVFSGIIGRFKRREGIILLLIYIVYIGLLIRQGRIA
ncbi:MAG: calcium/sodium antiporter [bacterium]